VRQALLVLGMHRSGTSALAGLIVRLGMHGPRTLIPPNEFNPLGYWESEPIVQFHDRVLHAAGSSWDAWAPLDTSFDAGPFASELTRILDAEFGSTPSFVVKDPRMCRFVPFWLGALAESGITPSAILIVRDPVDVSRSLATRDRLAPEFSLLMWLRHTLDAEHATRTIPRSVVSYRQLLTDWRSVADRIANDLRLTWPSAPDDAAIAQFLRPDLCHHAAGPGDLSAPPPLDRWVTEARDALDQLQRGAPALTDGAFAVLDDVRRELHAAGLAYGRTDETVRADLRIRLEQMDADRRAMDADRSRLDQQVTRLEGENAQTRTRAEAAERRAAGLEAAERRAAGLEAVLARAQQDAVSLQAQIERLQRTEHEQSAELASTKHRVDALLSSGSWRVTSPLRALLRAVRSVTRRTDPPAAD
jgi:hypothetical protein